MDEQSCSTSTDQPSNSSNFFFNCDFQTCVPTVSSKPMVYDEAYPKPVDTGTFAFRVRMRRCNTNYRRAINRYCDYDIKSRRLRNAVYTNNTHLVRCLLELGVKANSCDEQQRCPLHLAASLGYTHMVKLLLQYGANPNVKDDLGNTPLHLAACTNNIEIVTLLLNAGTDVSSLDNCGRSPLQLAQSKLRLIKEKPKSRIEPPEMQKLKDQVQQVVTMMLTYLQKQKTARIELDELSDKLNKLKTSDINDLDGEVSQLLDDLQILEINKK